jgi:hypothetical protein
MERANRDKTRDGKTPRERRAFEKPGKIAGRLGRVSRSGSDDDDALLQAALRYWEVCRRIRH